MGLKFNSHSREIVENLIDSSIHSRPSSKIGEFGGDVIYLSDSLLACMVVVYTFFASVSQLSTVAHKEHIYFVMTIFRNLRSQLSCNNSIFYC